LSIHFMYADINRTKENWFKAYPVFDNQGNLLTLPEHTPSQKTIFDDAINDIFDQYKQFLQSSPRSIRKE